MWVLVPRGYLEAPGVVARKHTSLRSCFAFRSVRESLNLPEGQHRDITTRDVLFWALYNTAQANDEVCCLILRDLHDRPLDNMNALSLLLTGS